MRLLINEFLFACARALSSCLSFTIIAEKVGLKSGFNKKTGKRVEAKKTSKFSNEMRRFKNCPEFSETDREVWNNLVRRAGGLDPRRQGGCKTRESVTGNSKKDGG
jgi:hypothetical protein